MSSKKKSTRAHKRPQGRTRSTTPNPEPTQTEVLLTLAASAKPFHTPAGAAFADVDVDGHRETWPLRGKAFRDWLALKYFRETRKAPRGESVQEAIGTLEARARFDAPERAVHVRVAAHEGGIYLDLADRAWQAVEIAPDGWRVINSADVPVRFHRAAGMLPLPLPVRGGSVEELRPFLNVDKNEDIILSIAFILAALRGRGPYPILVLHGEQGSAKSTSARFLRELVDPNTAPLRALPREDRDLFIAASNAHLLCFDNVSFIPNWLCDTLCRLATGGGFAARRLYTDGEEALFDATRPIVINGIAGLLVRGDLVDRAISRTLKAIPDRRRRQERKLLADFQRARPRILGALLDAVACGLRELPRVRLPKLPRMADFATWIAACEPALPWPRGAFLEAYAANRENLVEEVIAEDAVASAVVELMSSRAEWSGTATALLNELGARAGSPANRAKGWPATPNALSYRLYRAAQGLRRIGILVNRDRVGHPGTRTIHIMHK